jgi:hypothetical protein
VHLTKDQPPHPERGLLGIDTFHTCHVSSCSINFAVIPSVARNLSFTRML